MTDFIWKEESDILINAKSNQANGDSVKVDFPQHYGNAQIIFQQRNSKEEGTEDVEFEEESEKNQDDEVEQDKAKQKPPKRSLRRSRSNKRDSKTSHGYDGENYAEHHASEREEQPEKRDSLRSHKHSSSRRKLSLSASSRRHLGKGANRSGRPLVRESSSRRHRASRNYEREDSHRSSKRSHRSDNYNNGGAGDYNRSRRDVFDDDTSDSAENEQIEQRRERNGSSGRSKRRSSSRRQSSSDRRSFSKHREGSSRSDMRRQHRSDSRRFKEERSQSIPPVLPSSSSQPQATSQLSDLESPQSKTKKRKSKERQRASLFNSRYLCCCFCFLSIIVGVVVAVILLQKRVANSAALPPQSFDPPSSADCIAISKGNFVATKDENDVINTPRRFQINMQVEMMDQQDVYSNAVLSSSAKESMQIHLMPILAGCPESPRRLSDGGTHGRQLEETSLPEYIISNGMVIAAMLNPNVVMGQVESSQKRLSSRYLLLVIIDLWLQGEVKDDLLINKVLEGLERLDQNAIFQSQVRITESVVLGAEAMSTLDDITPFPTVSPTIPPSKTPTVAPTKLPSIYPSTVPSSWLSEAPSGLPSISLSLPPSPKPSQTPSTLPSWTPTSAPSSRPTGQPTSTPTTLSPTITTTKTPIRVDRSVDVVIVGAGAAGLTAAYHLEKQGLSVVLLEAANRYGGRMKQDNTWDVSLGLGPEWLHVDNPNDMLSRIVGRTVNKQTIAEPNLAHQWTGTTLSYNPPGDWSGDYRWVGGTWFDFFDQELAANLQANTIVLNSVVQTVDYEYQKPVVSLTNGRRYEGSYVIVTASVRALQLGEINFIPSLPSSHIDAINGIEMDITVKVFLEFTEKFYPDVFALDSDSDNYSSDCESSRHGERLFYDPTVGRITNTNILGMFTYAGIADLYTGQQESAVIQTLLNLLDEIFDGKASQTFVKGVVQDWAKEPHIRTAYTKYGSSRYRQRLREPIDGKLYFAGEAVRTSGAGWGYVHGAAYCGKDVAEEITGRIRG